MEKIHRIKKFLAMFFTIFMLTALLLPNASVFAASDFSTLTLAQQQDLLAQLGQLNSYAQDYQNVDMADPKCHVNEDQCIEDQDSAKKHYDDLKSSLLSGTYKDYVQISDKEIGYIAPSDIQVYNGDGFTAYQDASKTVAKLDSTNVPKLTGENYIVASEGLFTKPYVETESCPLKKAADEQDANKSRLNPLKPSGADASEDSGKFVQLIEDSISQVISAAVGIIFAPACPGNETSADGKTKDDAVKANFSVVSQMYNMYMPLNLTDNYLIMKLVSISQWMAYVIAIGMIIFYGIMYTSGYENLDPVKFGMRMFFAMLAVFFLPYLMQDILNLNNMVVHNMSSINITFDGQTTSVSAIFGLTLRDFATGITDGDILKNLFMLILCIVMIVLALQPIVSLITWWYMRMLKIFFYAIIGPMIVILIGLPSTARNASKWIEQFIGETFQQIFIVLAAMMLSFLFSNLTDFAAMTNLGWTGKILTLYSALFFLGHAPKYGAEFLGSIKGPDVSKQVTKGVKNLTGMATGAAAGFGAGLIGKEYAKGKGATKAITKLANFGGLGTNKTAKVAGKGALVAGKFADNATGGNVQKSASAVKTGAKHAVGGMKDWGARVASSQSTKSASAKLTGAAMGVGAVDGLVSGLSKNIRNGSGKNLTQRRQENRLEAHNNEKEAETLNKAAQGPNVDKLVNQAKEKDEDVTQAYKNIEKAEKAARVKTEQSRIMGERKKGENIKSQEAIQTAAKNKRELRQEKINQVKNKPRTEIESQINKAKEANKANNRNADGTVKANPLKTNDPQKIQQIAFRKEALKQKTEEKRKQLAQENPQFASIEKDRQHALAKSAPVSDLRAENQSVKSVRRHEEKLIKQGKSPNETVAQTKGNGSSKKV